MNDEIIKIPYNFKARGYQMPFFEAMAGGKKRAVLVWHRRAGKEKTCLNYMIMEMFKRVGSYYYYFPTTTLGRRILWDGSDKSGLRFLDHFPPEHIESKSSLEMKIRLKNGSLFQIVGTNQVINVGTNPVGVVFSEFSLQNPDAWAYIRPIIKENGGWAVFNFTPRGKNFAYDHLQMARLQEDWYTQVLTVDDTGVLTAADVEKEKAEGMSEEMVNQEYYCSFDRGVEGTYYGRLIDKARREGRIGRVPPDPAVPVFTSWDLGHSDSTSIVFFQVVGTAVHVIDYYENSNEGLDHYIRVVKEKGYLYERHFLPHDAAAKSLQTNMSLQSRARDMGLDSLLVPRSDIAVGIETTRSTIPRCWFDEHKCSRLLRCLESYHKRYLQQHNTYSSEPVHDWASHGADAFRYMCLSLQNIGRKHMTKEDVERLKLEAYGQRNYHPENPFFS